MQHTQNPNSPARLELSYQVQTVTQQPHSGGARLHKPKKSLSPGHPRKKRAPTVSTQRDNLHESCPSSARLRPTEQAVLTDEQIARLRSQSTLPHLPSGHQIIEINEPISRIISEKKQPAAEINIETQPVMEIKTETREEPNKKIEKTNPKKITCLKILFILCCFPLWILSVIYSKCAAQKEAEDEESEEERKDDGYFGLCVCGCASCAGLTAVCAGCFGK